MKWRRPRRCVGHATGAGGLKIGRRPSSCHPPTRHGSTPASGFGLWRALRECQQTNLGTIEGHLSVQGMHAVKSTLAGAVKARAA